MTNESIRTVVLGAVGSILATALILVLRGTTGGPPLQTWEIPLLWIGWATLVLSLSALAYVFLAFVVRGRIEPRIKAALEQDLRRDLEARIRKDLQSDLQRQIGLVESFSGFQECQNEILDALRTSKSVRIFLQIGRTVLRGGANFYDKLAESVQPDAEVKILHASQTNPYLSERAAYSRVGGGQKKYEEWLIELDYAIKRIENLARDHFAKSIEGRQHREGFVWRLFIFDDVAYVQPYLFESNNSTRAPVLKFSRLSPGARDANPVSLYNIFGAYFDLKWEENVPQKQSVSELIPEGQECAVAAVVRYHQFFIFAVPRRYIARSDRELPFHGIGGKRRAGETWLAALRREAAEEINSQLKIASCSTTRYLTTGGELDAIEVDDDPRPYCIYKRTRTVDPNFSDPEVLWLVGYDTVVQATGLESLRPGGEIGALVVFTGDMLKRALHDQLTYLDLTRARDRSRLIVAEGVELDLTRRAVPTGLATIVAAEYPARLIRRL